MKTFHKPLVIASAAIVFCVLGVKVSLDTKDAPPPIAQNNRTGNTEPSPGGYPTGVVKVREKPANTATLHAPTPHKTKAGDRQATREIPVPAGQSDQAGTKRPSHPKATNQFQRHLPQPLGEPQPPASLVWIDGLTPEQDAGIQKLAEDFKESLGTPSSPDCAKSYRDEAKLNEIRFQTRYGDQLWMRHHISAHHLETQEQK